MTQPLLTVKNLSKSFHKYKTVISALTDVSFEIYPGECLGIIGESGSGKSTLARILMQLLPASSGSIWLEGEEVLSLPRARKKELYGQMQMVFQDPDASLSPRMTISEILHEPLILQKKLSPEEMNSRIKELLNLVHLPRSSLGRYPHQFSGGQRQRIGIARALALQPKFLILDEPISALDVSIGAQIINLLNELKQGLGLTYLFIGHDLSMVRYLCDRALVLFQGRSVETNEIEELFAHPKDLYTQRLIEASPTLTKQGLHIGSFEPGARSAKYPTMK